MPAALWLGRLSSEFQFSDVQSLKNEYIKIKFLCISFKLGFINIEVGV